MLEYSIPISLAVSQVSCRLISIIEDPENELTVVSRELLHECWLELTALNAHIRRSDKKIAQLATNHPVCLRLMAIPGIGSIIATALIAAIGSVDRFKNGRELSAWPGAEAVFNGRQATGCNARCCASSAWFAGSVMAPHA